MTELGKRGRGGGESRERERGREKRKRGRRERRKREDKHALFPFYLAKKSHLVSQATNSRSILVGLPVSASN